MFASFKLSIGLAKCVLILASTASTVFAQERDRVFPAKGGAATTGKITERTPEKVVVEPNRGGPVEFATFDVARIIFDGEPSALSNAKQSALQGNWPQAENELSQVAPATLRTDDMKEEYQFYKGYVAANLALTGKGDPASAARLLLAWQKSFPNSHNYLLAVETLGNLAMVMGNLDPATRFYGAIASSNHPDMKVKGNYLVGKALLAQGKIDEAKARFSEAAQATVADPSSLRLQKLTRVALIRCDADAGNLDAAIQALEKLVSDEDSSDGVLFSEIFNTLGKIYEKQNNHYEAVISYLKTDKLYSNQVEAHAEALYQLSQLWPKVGEPLRGNQARAELSRLYPTSAWAKK